MCPCTYPYTHACTHAGCIHIHACDTYTYDAHSSYTNSHTSVHAHALTLGDSDRRLLRDCHYLHAVITVSNDRKQILTIIAYVVCAYMCMHMQCTHVRSLSDSLALYRRWYSCLFLLHNSRSVIIMQIHLCIRSMQTYIYCIYIYTLHHIFMQCRYACTFECNTYVLISMHARAFPLWRFRLPCATRLPIRCL